MSPLVSAVERLYQEISQASVPPQPAQKTEQPTEPTLTRADVDAIVQYKRGATPQQLQYILDHAADFQLQAWQRDKISLQLTVAIAAKIRAAHGIRDANPFLYNTLRVVETPYGLLHDREWAENLLKQGTRAIWQCKNHRPPRCNCWRPVRDVLWDVRVAYGDKSPESWVALRIWQTLEDLETASRPAPEPGVI